jgi:CBS domain-containing protein
MTQPQPETNDISLLPIRVRRTLRPDTDENEALSVFCSRRQSSVPLDECVVCERCAGLGVDPSEESVFLRCRSKRVQGPVEGSQAPEPEREATSVKDADRVRLGEVMTADVTCVHPDLGIDTLALLFLERGISAAPVVADDGRVLGVVSKTDLIREQYENGSVAEVEQPRSRASGDQDEIERGFHVERFRYSTVREIMTPVAFMLYESSSVARAAALMAYEGVHRVPVVTRDGCVVGIVSSLDLLRWLAKNSGFLLPRRRTHKKHLAGGE